jgi:hypothetical protein
MDTDETPDHPGTLPAAGRRPARWSSDQGRALLLPLAGMAAAVVLVAMSMVWPVDGQVATAAVVGVLTLAAATGGHAAGTSRRRD